MAAEKQFENISIHSLRMEGDNRAITRETSVPDFNPLPPHGGRLTSSYASGIRWAFQSTPSAWRETLVVPREI